MTQFPTSRRHFTLGLDLGQASDPSALAILERSPKPREINAMNRAWPASGPLPAHFFHLRLLERFPLQTTYSSVIARVRALLKLPNIAAGSAALVVDATGVGAPIVETLRSAPLHAALIPVVITSGHNTTHANYSYRVPKKELISSLTLALETQSLRIPKSLPNRKALFEEFAAFRTTISANGRTTYAAAPGAHDDLILALSLALWWARPKPPCGPQSQGPLL